MLLAKKYLLSFAILVSLAILQFNIVAQIKPALADSTLGISMKSVGEAMSIGRTFKESLQKGLRSLEIKKFGLESSIFNNLEDLKVDDIILDKIIQKLDEIIKNSYI